MTRKKSYNQTRTVKKEVRRKMRQNLLEGKKYGRGGDFWHPHKNDIEQGNKPNRYKGK